MRNCSDEELSRRPSVFRDFVCSFLHRTDETENSVLHPPTLTTSASATAPPKPQATSEAPLPSLVSTRPPTFCHAPAQGGAPLFFLDIVPALATRLQFQTQHASYHSSPVPTFVLSHTPFPPCRSPPQGGAPLFFLDLAPALATRLSFPCPLSSRLPRRRVSRDKLCARPTHPLPRSRPLRASR
jgi:hypothetical protein